jgi:hypothetical protein
MSVDIRIKAVNAFKKGIDGAIRAVRKLGSVVASAAKVVAAATLAMTAAAIVSVRSYMKQQSAEEELAAAIINRGKAVDDILPKYKEFAAAMQKLTIYGDEAILSNMAYGMNLGITADQMEEATKAAIGLAGKYKLDLRAAMMLVGRASQGQTEMLTRYGIVLDKTLNKEQKFNALLKIGSGAFGLAEAEAKTLRGSLTALRNVWGDLLETIGQQISDGTNLKGLFGDLQERITSFTSSLKESKFVEIWAEKLRGLVDDVLTIMDAIAGGGEKGKAAWEGLKRWGVDMAKEAGAVLLSYAPIIGDAIGTAARAAFKGARTAMNRRVGAAEQLAAERGGKSLNRWDQLGILGMGPQSAEISRRAAQAKAQALREQGQALAAKFAGGTGTTLHGLAMDLTDNTITKLGKATADSMKEEK